MDAAPAPVPGWYADPHDVRLLRWWDGTGWTAHTHPARPAVVAPPLPRWWGGLSVAAQVALGVAALTGLLNLYVDRRVLALADEVARRGVPVTVAERDALGGVLWLSTAALPATLVAGVLVITWLHTAHRSSRMDRSLLRHGSGWAVGGWFVPVLNYWRPFQVVCDVRRGATGDPDARAGALQVCWWLAFCGTYVLGTVSQVRGTFTVPAPGDPVVGYSSVLVAVAGTHQWAAALQVLAAVLAIAVVRDVTRLVLAPPPEPRADR
ncbi:DUF4328 domain-containing protein [Nocardioides sp. J2M5]|uniref:DUF4328 domain-containing protein n=1 Tax=Nocardioides palaemonis TaxID=2829810 RepID=UPI001BAA07BB|nr:DUF4328 domain-containing protein [Nocardioides palaemonis]MBS2939165.1 DUF4328 domain-containing protein [Nocardioides palaemonis]